MPTVERGTHPDGRTRYVRLPYSPEHYTVPERYLREVQTYDRGRNAAGALAEPGGAFAGCLTVRTFARDGRQFVVKQRLSLMGEWAVEVEVTGDTIGEIRALPPEEAWALARARDLAHDPPVELVEA